MRAARFFGTVLVGCFGCGAPSSPPPSVAPLPPVARAPWSVRLGGPGEAVVFALALDAAGNVVLVGQFNDTVDLGGGALTSAGRRDGFVVKLDPSGKYLWGKHFGSEWHESMNGVAIDAAGNVIVVGSFSGPVDFGAGPVDRAERPWADLFVAKYGPGGEHLWSRPLRGGGERPRSAVALDAKGDVYVTGHFEQRLSLGGAWLESVDRDDVFVAKLSGADGAHRWSRSAGGPGMQTASGVAVTPAGQVIVVGEYEKSLDFGAGALTSRGGEDGFVAAFEGATGRYVWGSTLGGPKHDGALRVAVDGAGNAFVVGTVDGDVDPSGGGAEPAARPLWPKEPALRAFVVKVDPAGKALWSRRFGEGGQAFGLGAAVSREGGVVMTGTVEEKRGATRGFWSESSSDAFVVRFDAAGRQVGSRRYGGSGAYTMGHAVAVDPAGQSVLAGRFSGRVVIGAQALESTDVGALFVARLPVE